MRRGVFPDRRGGCDRVPHCSVRHVRGRLLGHERRAGVGWFCGVRFVVVDLFHQRLMKLVVEVVTFLKTFPNVWPLAMTEDISQTF